MTRKFRTFFYVFIVFASMLPFQNCSAQFELKENFSGLAKDESLNTLPEIYFEQIPEVVNTSEVIFNFQIRYSGASVLKAVTCQFNSLPTLDCSSGQAKYNGLSDGDHSFKIAVETMSNISIERTIVFKKDSTLPILSVASVPPSISNQTSASFSFVAADNLSGIRHIECSLDNTAFTTCSSPFTVSNLASGPRNVRIRVEDNAGNFSAIYSHNWTVNLTFPTVSIELSPSVVTNSSTARFEFSGDGIVSYECQLDNTPFTVCSSPHTLQNLVSNREHIFRVRGRNTAGTLSIPTQFNWTIDTVPPSAPALMSSVSNFSMIRNASVSFSSMDTLSGVLRFECAYNSGSFSHCTNPRGFSNLIDGNHSLQVRSIDNALNVSAVSTFNWQVDTVSPTLAFSQIPLAQSTETSASFTFAASDIASGMGALQCSLDSGTFVPCASPVSISNLALGSHTYRIQAIDRAGNITSINHSWVISTPNIITPINQTIDVYAHLNSLHNHGTGQFTSSTNVGNWITRFTRQATNSTKSYTLGAQFGFFNQWTLPPRSRVYHSEVSTPHLEPYFDSWNGAQNIDVVQFVPDNFDGYSFDPAAITNIGASYQTVLLSLIDQWEANAPNAQRRYVIYAGWPQLNNYGVSSVGSLTQSHINNWISFGLGSYQTWMELLVSRLRAARPGLDIRLHNISKSVLIAYRDTVVRNIPMTELFEDLAPHGRASWYFLAAVADYIALYGEKPPANFIFENSWGVSPVITSNYQSIVDVIWNAR